MKTIVLAILMALASSSLAFAACAWNGGDEFDCIEKWKAQPRQPISGIHASGDTYALTKATCVTADSQWVFHSARDAYTGRMTSDGNRLQLTQYRRFPRVRAWARVAFADGLDHMLSGEQLGQLGVPICGGW